MNTKQKLGYMALGAGILALGITIGQWTTPNIEAQGNGVFDKIRCRGLEVVDANGRRAIVLTVNELVSSLSVLGMDGNSGIILSSVPYESELTVRDTSGKQGIKLSSRKYGGDNERIINNVTVFNERGKEGVILQSAIPLESPKGGRWENRVDVYSPLGKPAIGLQSSQVRNWFSVQDKKNADKAAFAMSSNNSDNTSVRWIRGRGRMADW